MIEENSVLQYKGQKRSGDFLKWLPLTIVIVLIWLGVSVITGFATSGSKKCVVAETPAEAARLWEEQTNKQHAHSFTHLKTKEYSECAVVIYELPSNPLEMLYYQIVRHDHSGWYIDSIIDGHGNSMHFAVGLEDHLAFSWYPLSEPAIIYGKTLSDEVAEVEVTYASGQIIRVPVEDGLYVLISYADPNYDSVRALDEDGEVLGEHINGAY